MSVHETPSANQRRGDCTHHLILHTVQHAEKIPKYQQKRRPKITDQCQKQPAKKQNAKLFLTKINKRPLLKTNQSHSTTVENSKTPSVTASRPSREFTPKTGQPFWNPCALHFQIVYYIINLHCNCSNLFTLLLILFFFFLNEDKGWRRWWMNAASYRQPPCWQTGCKSFWFALLFNACLWTFSFFFFFFVFFFLFLSQLAKQEKYFSTISNENPPHTPVSFLPMSTVTDRKMDIFKL